MLNILFIFGYILSIQITITSASIEGHKSSLIFLSNNNHFEFNLIKNLIAFGDSLTSENENFSFETDQYKSVTNRSENKWGHQLTKKNKMTFYDFAIWGATINENIVPTDHKISYFVQYDNFKNKMKNLYDKKWNSNNTLFSYWLGTNDILFIDRKKYMNVMNETFDVIVDNLFNTMEETYSLGGRNFLFINVPALDETPLTDEKDKFEVESNVIHFNERINTNALNFYKRHNDINVFVYNMRDEVKYIMENYSKFGFISNTTFYYEDYEDYEDEKENDDDNKYIWLDGIHFTDSMNQLFANNIELFLKNDAQHLLAKSSIILFIIFYLLF